MQRFFLSLSVLATVACGGLVTFVEEGDGNGGNGSSTDGGNGPDTVGASMGGSMIVATIDEAQLLGGCKPPAGPDPLTGSVFIAYSNTGTGAGSLEITGAQVTFSNSFEAWVFSVELSPTGSGLVAPNDNILTEHLKVATDGDASFVCSLCGMSGNLKVTFVDGQGVAQDAVKDFPLSCAF